MVKGKVKFFNSVKNFGFIELEDGKDIFVHGSDILDDARIAENDEVEFEVAEGNKGDKAINVKRL